MNIVKGFGEQLFMVRPISAIARYGSYGAHFVFALSMPLPRPVAPFKMENIKCMCLS